MNRYELFYSKGGHGGPYPSVEAAKHAAERLMAGGRDTWIAIVPSNQMTMGPSMEPEWVIWRDQEWVSSNGHTLKDVAGGYGKSHSDWARSGTEKIAAHHVGNDGKWYVDSAFINHVQHVYPGSVLEHMGFGEFYLDTPDGRLDFDRMRGVNFEGQIGRSHRLSDDAGGKVIEKALHLMERAGKSMKMAGCEKLPEGGMRDNCEKKTDKSADFLGIEYGKLAGTTRVGSLSDFAVLEGLVSLTMENMIDGGDPDRDLVNKLKPLAKRYSDEVRQAMTEWVHKNPSRMNLTHRAFVSRRATRPAEIVAVLDDYGHRGNGTAAFLYYMEVESHGVGTWDGDWDGLFSDATASRDLSKYVHHSTHPTHDALSKAILDAADKSAFGDDEDRTASTQVDLMARFEEGVSADPTENMSPEDKKRWWEEHEKNKDKFKKAARLSTYEDLLAEGCPANLDESECKEWEANTEKYKDKFKTATTKRDMGLVYQLSARYYEATTRGDYEAAKHLYRDYLREFLAVLQSHAPVNMEALNVLERNLARLDKAPKTADYEPGERDDTSPLDGDRDPAASDLPDGEGNTVKRAAVTPGGLYGFPKGIQADCETCVRKVGRSAATIARTAYQKDPKVAVFLATHAKRSSSLPAKILMSAMEGLGPKFASVDPELAKKQARLEELRASHPVTDGDKTAAKYHALFPFDQNTSFRKGDTLVFSGRGWHDAFKVVLIHVRNSDSDLLKLQGGPGEEPYTLYLSGLFKGQLMRHGGEAIEYDTVRRLASTKTAGASTHGLYGFTDKTANIGLTACMNLREQAGRTAYDLHKRRPAKHGAITGFLKEHCKTAKCATSRLLSDCYPGSDCKTASPVTVEDWISWDE